MNLRHLLLLSVTLIFLSSCSAPKNNFFVHNMDAETIDSLRIFVGDETYLIEDLQPRKTKGIRIYKMGGKQITLQADDGKSMALSGILQPPFRGKQRLIITKKRIISSSTYSN